MSWPAVVLVRPQSGENIGLVVRLCANFGLEAPRLVAPEPGWEREAARTATMCRELLARTRLYESLAQAAADCEELIGFTARAGKDREVVPLDQAFASDSPTRARTTALVFGNERTGLDEEECSFCTGLVHIPVPGLTSLNLSHAVAIALQAWFRPGPTADAVAAPERTTTLDERERFAGSVRTTLAQLGYRVEDPHLEGALRRLVRGARLERRDLRILHKILTHLEWVRRHGLPGEEP